MPNNNTDSPATSRKRQKEAENWDDDFEFSLPSKSRHHPKVSSTSSTSRPEPSSSSSTRPASSIARRNEDDRENVNPHPTHPQKGKGRRTPSSSREPDWDEEESWDELPPPLPPSPPKHISPNRPAPLNIPPNPYANARSNDSVNPPRLSPSQYADLPSPSPLPTPYTSASYAHQALLPSRSHSSLARSQDLQPSSSPMLSRKPRSRSGSTATGTDGTTVRNKLIKRHPSTSFIPITNRASSHNLSATANASEISISSITYPNRSSPNLPRSTSGEQMPPPPLPMTDAGRIRSSSRSKNRPASRQDARVSNIPFSPSKEEQPKRPGFWKRLSGAPNASLVRGDDARQHNQDVPQRRRRSSSVGGKRMPEPASPQPPLPPLPANLRSPSSTSTQSTSSSNHSGPRSAFSAMLRRSSSSLSKRSDKSRERDTPPSSYPYFSADHDRSSSASLASYPPPLLPMTVPRSASRSGANTPDLQSSSSFSRGFHLPSPSPGSPYHASKRIPQGPPPPLPHSTSFPVGQGVRADDSDTETEADGKTPRRRRKVRPVSALPAPRLPSSTGWSGDGWKGFDLPQPQSATASTTNIPGLATNRCDHPSPKLNSVANSGGFASTTTSTLRRLGSLSKKHGRRLSGGFKFNGNGNQNQAQNASGATPVQATPLETVMGSPSKPSRGTEDLASSPTPLSTLQSEQALQSVLRAGSISAPNSTFKPGPPLDMPSPSPTVEEHIAAIAPAATAKRKDEKHKRRQSWNDFVIPREVLEKQRGLKEKISAVKTFAGGVETLKTLLAKHDELRESMFSSTRHADPATFQALDQEFAQWWEMAVVLIEVGSTGRDPSTQASLSDPPRSRRVTLASDEAKAASEMMRKVSSAPGTDGVSPSLGNLRKTSLPDPSENSLGMTSGSGPPRASPLLPEQWRASTGRQDLSKRQLEVLRTMLRTPAPIPPSTSASAIISHIHLNTDSPGSVRPLLGARGASTLSASSTSNSLMSHSPRLGGTLGPSTSRSRTPESESISFPSPGDSAHIVPSGSFPSPLSAARQQKTLTIKDRRASKAGLAGLKEFLRSLQNRNKDRPTNNANASGQGDQPIPTPLRRGFRAMARSPSQVVVGRSLWSKSNPVDSPPPASPTSPITPAFFSSRNDNDNGYDEDQVFYPTNRTSFSALGAPVTSRQGNKKYTPRRQTLVTTSEKTSPRPFDSDAPKRPSLKNIFRHSSGGWNDLIRSDEQIAGNGKGSPESSLNLNTSSVEEKENNHSPSPFRKKSKEQLSTTTTKNGRQGISVSDPIPSRIPITPSTSTSTSATGIILSSSPEKIDVTANGQGTDEMTLRPGKKSRSAGLGLGLGWPEPLPLSGTVGGIEMEVGGMREIDEYGTLTGNGNGKEEKTITRHPRSGRGETEPELSGYEIQQVQTAVQKEEEEEEEGMKMVALTPENLPVLLEYMKQCEIKLVEWKRRVEQLEFAQV